jgi:hypothetical protein
VCFTCELQEQKERPTALLHPKIIIGACTTRPLR